jgi:hypothetical protein
LRNAERRVQMFNCSEYPFGIDSFLFGWLPTAATASLALLVAFAFRAARARLAKPDASLYFFRVYAWALAVLSVLLAFSAWDCKGEPGVVSFIPISKLPMALIFGFGIHFPQRFITIPLGLMRPNQVTFLISVGADALVVLACVVIASYR